MASSAIRRHDPRAVEPDRAQAAFDHLLQFLATGHLVDAHNFQAVPRAHIHTAIAQDALAAIENSLHTAFQTSAAFSDGLLEYPQYTRPAEFEGHAVPDVLLSGNHAEVARFRTAQAVAKTRRMRPDLGARIVEVPAAHPSKAAPRRLGRPVEGGDV